MGKTLVKAKIENQYDIHDAAEGRLPLEKIRAVEVDDALADTGATMLCLPKRLVRQLGLTRYRTRRVRTSAGLVNADVYRGVQLTVQGRDCNVDVCEIPDICPVLIGQIPLELLDFLVDPVHQRLLGNPEHGGEQMIEIFTFWPAQ